MADTDRWSKLLGSSSVESNQVRLEIWERRSRPAIIAAAIVPLIGVSTGQSEFGPIGNLIEVVCWLIFVVDLMVHMRLRPGYLHSGMGKFDLSVVILTSPWYLLPGVSAGQFVTLLRLARLARVAMVGLKSPVIKRTLDRLGKPFLYVGIMLMVCAAIVERAEHHQNGFKTYGDSLWWGVVTITTVGYGDLVPETRLGRVTATVLMFTGIAMLGTVAASLASLFRLEDKADEEQAEAAEQTAAALGGRVAAATTADTVATASTSAAEPGTAPATELAITTDVAAELRALREEIAALRAEIADRPLPPP